MLAAADHRRIARCAAGPITCSIQPRVKSCSQTGLLACEGIRIIRRGQALQGEQLRLIRAFPAGKQIAQHAAVAAGCQPLRIAEQALVAGAQRRLSQLLPQPAASRLSWRRSSSGVPGRRWARHRPPAGSAVQARIGRIATQADEGMRAPRRLRGWQRRRRPVLEATAGAMEPGPTHPAGLLNRGACGQGIGASAAPPRRSSSGVAGRAAAACW